MGIVNFEFKARAENIRDLGTFIEVEAIDETGNIGIQKLKEQCERYFFSSD
ncbi:MAG TPA: hypothetical protein VMW32_03535 [Bacteroidales bacterium]|nr:hypothetical protein [Bacteroidales bacterium]